MYRIIKAFGRFLARRTPNTLDRMARVVAVLVFDVIRLRRRVILSNLALAFKDEFTPRERIRIGRASVYHFVLTIFEFLQSVENDLLANITVQGYVHGEPMIKSGSGAYILCGHLGNWEACGGAGAKFGRPTHAIVKEVGAGAFNRLTDELRRKCGLIPIYRKPAGQALRAIKAALAQGDFVAFMLDQSRPGAPYVPFFDEPARTQTSLAVFARKFPAPILPVSIRRLSPGCHEITAWPVLSIERTEDAEADVTRATQQFNAMLETMIRTAPEQYFWMHKRWK